MGLSRRKAPFPMQGGVVLSSDPGLSGPSLESGLAGGGSLALAGLPGDLSFLPTSNGTSQ